MSGFPSYSGDAIGIDLEASLRSFIGRLTGLRGQALTDLIDRGTEEGRRTELDEAVRAGRPARGIGSRREDRGLSLAERRTITLVACGYTNEQIGARLYVSPETVKSHIKHTLSRLGATNRTEAVLLALLLGHLDHQALLDHYGHKLAA